MLDCRNLRRFCPEIVIVLFAFQLPHRDKP
jgi:hypothetical protein